MYVHILPPEVRSRISAGEVIERPADVVKELVENSLDAGATQIRVEITKGGKRRIVVSDNGEGIHPEDMDRILMEGATSKIATESDLSNIRTFGFRGEALFAISSVSRISVSSRHYTSSEGYRLTAEGGKILGKRVIGMGIGTIVEVRDLFFNQPVRLKFLKREEAEARRVKELIKDLALSKPACGFELVSNGKEVLRLSPSSEEERCRELIGEGMETTTLSQEPYQIRLYFKTGFKKGDIRIFVNSRRIQHREITDALKKVVGYTARAVLFIELPPYLVDFNVHPKKKEVRFLEENRIISILKNSFYTPSYIPVPSLARPQREEFEVIGQMEGTFVIVRIGDYLYFFDQHLLDERVNYERMGEGSENRACRISIKAGEKLSRSEMEDLVKRWLDSGSPRVCPHGRPIYHRIHVREIYERLGRGFPLY